MLNYKKPVFLIIWVAVVLMAAGIILLLAVLIETIELPDETSVSFIEMEQINDRLSVGCVTITDTEQINEILSAISGAKKTLRYSVNDNPVEHNYLIIKIHTDDKTTTLYLYSDRLCDYVEEPYVGIYRARRNTSKTLYRLYGDFEKGSYT